SSRSRRKRDNIQPAGQDVLGPLHVHTRTYASAADDHRPGSVVSTVPESRRSAGRPRKARPRGASLSGARRATGRPATLRRDGRDPDVASFSERGPYRGTGTTFP